MQEAGIVVVLNEIATALGLLVILAAKICKVPRKPFNQIKEACVKCLQSVGALNIETLDEAWKQIKHPKVKEAD